MLRWSHKDDNGCQRRRRVSKYGAGWRIDAYIVLFYGWLILHSDISGPNASVTFCEYALAKRLETIEFIRTRSRFRKNGRRAAHLSLELIAGFSWPVSAFEAAIVALDVVQFGCHHNGLCDVCRGVRASMCVRVCIRCIVIMHGRWTFWWPRARNHSHTNTQFIHTHTHNGSIGNSVIAKTCHDVFDLIAVIWMIAIFMKLFFSTADDWEFNLHRIVAS